jgi:cystinosin
MAASPPSFLAILSWLFGWIYFLCWSFSFYPQPILNWRRRSTTGTTVDFPTINVLGFVAYFISNAAFIYSNTVRKDYALRHKGLTPTVQLNDLAFAAHAIVLSTLTLSQFVPSIWGFEKRGRGAGAVPSKSILGLCVGCFVGVGIVVSIVVLRHDTDPVTGWAWIDVVSYNIPLPLILL